ncbi:type ISP restriction/modification enzyme, partial [Staphylococcus aureus]|uniref:type ISP restriction/modification enzyme n=1 Tax=Staphylococcus aureus TaxID=1280 RepID=UPI0039BE6064
FNRAHAGLDKKSREVALDRFIDTDPTKISWSVGLKQELVRGRSFSFTGADVVESLYRPFCKQWMYFNRRLNERVLQMPRIFPSVACENRVIGFSAASDRSALSVLMSDHVPSY